jgi:protein-tyrosine phosphatase
MRLINRFGLVLAGFALAVSPGAPAAFARPVAVAKSDSARQRFVLLDGGQNFRDMGGYRTADGRRVKWGVLYRSGSMAKLTIADFQKLQSLRIRTIVDLRDNGERTREPLSRPATFTPAVLVKDYALDRSEIGKALGSPNLTGEQAREVFDRFYAALPFTFADQYRQLFAQLLAGNAPLIVNCSAGKDRTGVASALILTALGVPRATVIQDYLLSKQGFQPGKTASGVDPRMAGFSPEVAQVLAGVEPRFLNAAFKAIESRPGGLNGYFRNELGLTPADLKRLKSLYLE